MSLKTNCFFEPLTEVIQKDRSLWQAPYDLEKYKRFHKFSMQVLKKHPKIIQIIKTTIEKMKNHKETRAKRCRTCAGLNKYKRFHKFSVQQAQRSDAKTPKTRKSEVRLQRPGGRPYVGPLGALKNIQNALIFISFQ